MRKTGPKGLGGGSGSVGEYTTYKIYHREVVEKAYTVKNVNSFDEAFEKFKSFLYHIDDPDVMEVHVELLSDGDIVTAYDAFGNSQERTVL